MYCAQSTSCLYFVSWLCVLINISKQSLVVLLESTVDLLRLGGLDSQSAPLGSTSNTERPVFSSCWCFNL